ncbi:hypothetical protein KY337_00225 [Candidatus Woesearchaeota archaeon]|nr:hypothetical protein [Candidatus Woesearchaeota archaeon]
MRKKMLIGLAAIACFSGCSHDDPVFFPSTNPILSVSPIQIEDIRGTKTISWTAPWQEPHHIELYLHNVSGYSKLLGGFPSAQKQYEFDSSKHPDGLDYYMRLALIKDGDASPTYERTSSKFIIDNSLQSTSYSSMLSIITNYEIYPSRKFSSETAGEKPLNLLPNAKYTNPLANPTQVAEGFLKFNIPSSHLQIWGGTPPYSQLELDSIKNDPYLRKAFPVMNFTPEPGSNVHLHFDSYVNSVMQSNPFKGMRPSKFKLEYIVSHMGF